MSLAVKDDGSAAVSRLVHFRRALLTSLGFHDSKREGLWITKNTMAKREALAVIRLRCAAGWLAGGFQAGISIQYFCMLSSAENSLHLSVFRKSGLLGRCWALIAQVAGSLFLCVVKVSSLPVPDRYSCIAIPWF